jgi:SAM-dependent methyltransferase
MCVDSPWLAAQWPFVREHLPTGPSTVLELGCGPAGGFVPLLRDAGVAAVGVDPQAPDEAGYARTEFERYQPARPVDAVIACTSLHHVADVDEVLAQVEAALRPGGTLVVVEWDWERFDEATAQWCFARLAPPSPGREPGWLHRHRDDWARSEQPWDGYVRDQAHTGGLHTGRDVLQALDARYARELCSRHPYFFPDLNDTTATDEQAAIDRGQIRAGGIRYVGRRR